MESFGIGFDIFQAAPPPAPQSKKNSGMLRSAVRQLGNYGERGNPHRASRGGDPLDANEWQEDQ